MEKEYPNTVYDPLDDAELKALLGETESGQEGSDAYTDPDFAGFFAQTLSDPEPAQTPPKTKKEANPKKLVIPMPGGRKWPVYAGAAVLMVVILVAGYFLLNTLLDPYDCRILDNVTLGGVDVGGMTRSEARKALKAATEDTFSAEDMVVELPDATLRLSPADTKVRLKLSSAVNAAYRVGRTGSKEEKLTAYEETLREGCQISLADHLNYKESAIREALEAYAAQYNTENTPLSYTMEGAKPHLQEDQFSETAPCQTLALTLGVPQVELDVDAVLQSILDTYGENNFLLQIPEITPLSVPEEPDLDALWEEFCSESVNTTLDMKTYQQIPGVYGYRFDKAEAQKQISQAKAGETVSIPMEYVRPEILGDEAYFRDVLGSCETKHTDDENRNNNLRLACAALDGKILQPGEEFSYNDTLGERTEAKGYKRAGAYSGTALVRSVGGGICQGSTTLYYCTLIADLEIVFRINHGYAVNYIDLGLDATVNWGGPDFKFRNNFNFPIKIQAEVSDGYMKMKILGTDEKDYYVVMESTAGWGADTIYAKSYKCKYDKETDELISREMEARSNYMR